MFDVQSEIEQRIEEGYTLEEAVRIARDDLYTIRKSDKKSRAMENDKHVNRVRYNHNKRKY